MNTNKSENATGSTNNKNSSVRLDDLSTIEKIKYQISTIFGQANSLR